MKRRFWALVALALAAAMGFSACSFSGMPAEHTTHPDENSDGLCDIGGEALTPSGGETPGGNTGETPRTYGWNTAPVQKATFYDDFSEGIDLNNWTSDDNGWGLDKANNNGVTSKNISYSTNAARVEEAGATGGIIVFQANGGYSEDPYKGAVITTRNDFGAGKYEARIKVLPRQGQCTALWTYFNGTPNLTSADDLSESKYSEIDIELPEGGDFRKFTATTYSKYISKTQMEQTSSKIDYEKVGLGNLSLNDGAWHTVAFEWRTAENDTGIIWYIDGHAVQKLTTSVPVYTAPFNIGTHFPDIPSWLGVPNFDTAYMYLDWVRITEYDDPVTDEYTAGTYDPAKEKWSFRDLGDGAIPQTNYVANGDFRRLERGSTDKPYVWQADGLAVGSEAIRGTTEDYVNYLLVKGGNRIFQSIDSKYIGHKLRLVVRAERIEGEGELRARLEGLYGIVSMETSEALSFKHNMVITKELTYEIANVRTNTLRVVFETDADTVARVYSVELYLV